MFSALMGPSLSRAFERTIGVSAVRVVVRRLMKGYELKVKAEVVLIRLGRG